MICKTLYDSLFQLLILNCCVWFVGGGQRNPSLLPFLVVLLKGFRGLQDEHDGAEPGKNQAARPLEFINLVPHKLDHPLMTMI